MLRSMSWLHARHMHMQSVVNLRSDLESGEESDDEDKFSIVEDLESTYSGASGGSSNSTSTYYNVELESKNGIPSY